MRNQGVRFLHYRKKPPCVDGLGICPRYPQRRYSGKEFSCKHPGQTTSIGGLITEGGNTVQGNGFRFSCERRTDEPGLG